MWYLFTIGLVLQLIVFQLNGGGGGGNEKQEFIVQILLRHFSQQLSDSTVVTYQILNFW